MQAHILNRVRQSFDRRLHDVWQKVHNIIFWDSTTYNTQINLDIWWKAQNTTKPFQDTFLRCKTLISNFQLICPSMVQVWQQYHHFNRNTNIGLCRKVLHLTLKSKWVGETVESDWDLQLEERMKTSTFRFKMQPKARSSLAGQSAGELELKSRNNIPRNICTPCTIVLAKTPKQKQNTLKKERKDLYLMKFISRSVGGSWSVAGSCHWILGSRTGGIYI